MFVDLTRVDGNLQQVEIINSQVKTFVVHFCTQGLWFYLTIKSTEREIIVRSYIGSRLLCQLTFPLKNVKDLQRNVKGVLKGKSHSSNFSNFWTSTFLKLKKSQNFVDVTAIWLFWMITTFAFFRRFICTPLEIRCSYPRRAHCYVICQDSEGWVHTSKIT